MTVLLTLAVLVALGLGTCALLALCSAADRCAKALERMAALAEGDGPDVVAPGTNGTVTHKGTPVEIVREVGESA